MAPVAPASNRPLTAMPVHRRATLSPSPLEPASVADPVISADRRWWIIAIALAATFVTCAVLVSQGRLSGLDAALRQLARPDDIWGTTQIRADLVIEGLRPTVLLVIMALFTTICCAIRRSISPALIGTAGFLIAASATLAVKLIVGRPDPHGYVAAYSGSFPSGHVVTIVVSLGLAALVLRPQAPWWVLLLPAAVSGTLMGLCLLIQSAHWASDVFGGQLLALCVLAVMRATLDALRHRVSDNHSTRDPPLRRMAQEVRAGDRRDL